MKKFTDLKGREWTIELTIGSVKRIKDLVQVDLFDAKQGGIFECLTSSDLSGLVTLCDVLFATCKPQADELKVSDVEFGASLGPNVVAVAIDAFIEEVIDFFRQVRPPMGAVLGTLWEKIQAGRTEEMAAISRILSNPGVDQVIQEALQKAEEKATEMLGELCGSSPA